MRSTFAASNSPAALLAPDSKFAAVFDSSTCALASAACGAAAVPSAGLRDVVAVAGVATGFSGGFPIFMMFSRLAAE
jgi:hypothetical protein